MRKSITLGMVWGLITFASAAMAGDTYVNGYVRRDGTYVQGHHRSTPDNTVNNNYGTQGNQNPYTGAYGTQPRNESQPAGQYNLGNGMGYGIGNSNDNDND